MTRKFHQQLKVGMITCERPIPTLDVALEMAEIAGVGVAYIQRDKERVGAWANWRACLAWLVNHADYFKSEFVMVLEDDAVVSNGLGKYLDTLTFENNTIYSLYCANGSPANRELTPANVGFARVEAPRFAYGALALLMHIDLARKILKDPPFPERRDGTDHAIGVFCKQQNIPYYVHFPSLVKHIGAVSSLAEPGGVDEFRQAKYWVSDCADGKIAVIEELRPPITWHGTKPAG